MPRPMPLPPPVEPPFFTFSVTDTVAKLVRRLSRWSAWVAASRSPFTIRMRARMAAAWLSSVALASCFSSRFRSALSSWIWVRALTKEAVTSSAFSVRDWTSASAERSRSAAARLRTGIRRSNEPVPWPPATSVTDECMTMPP